MKDSAGKPPTGPTGKSEQQQAGPMSVLVALPKVANDRGTIMALPFKLHWGILNS